MSYSHHTNLPRIITTSTATVLGSMAGTRLPNTSISSRHIHHAGPAEFITYDVTAHAFCRDIHIPNANSPVMKAVTSLDFLFQDRQYFVGGASHQGNRDYQEDRFGGGGCPSLFFDLPKEYQEKVFPELIKRLQNCLREEKIYSQKDKKDISIAEGCGTTLTMVVVLPEGFWTANVGDSFSAYYPIDKKTGAVVDSKKINPISGDLHNLWKLCAGMKVKKDDVFSVETDNKKIVHVCCRGSQHNLRLANCGVNLYRSLGDFQAIKDGLSDTPTVLFHALDRRQATAVKAAFLLASDGLYDTYPISSIKDNLNNIAKKGMPEHVARQIIDASLPVKAKFCPDPIDNRTVLYVDDLFQVAGRYYFLMDGHGGDRVVEFLVNILHREFEKAIKVIFNYYMYSMFKIEGRDCEILADRMQWIECYTDDTLELDKLLPRLKGSHNNAVKKDFDILLTAISKIIGMRMAYNYCGESIPNPRSIIFDDYQFKTDYILSTSIRNFIRLMENKCMEVLYQYDYTNPKFRAENIIRELIAFFISIDPVVINSSAKFYEIKQECCWYLHHLLNPAQYPSLSYDPVIKKQQLTSYGMFESKAAEAATVTTATVTANPSAITLTKK